MKAFVGEKVHNHSFLASSVDRRKLSASRPGRFNRR